MTHLKIYTQVEFDALPIVNGCRICPTGDYSQIKDFGDVPAFGYSNSYGYTSKFGHKGPTFGYTATFG